MASTEELSFKVAQAKSWKENVLAELEMVDTVLKAVSTEIQTTPAEDDTIFRGIKAGGEALQRSYEVLEKNFKQAVLGLDPIIGAWQNMISNILSGLQETVRKIGQD